jgi:hypothetical protein
MNHAPCRLCITHHQVYGAQLARRGCVAGALTLLCCGAPLAQVAPEPRKPAEMSAAVLSAPTGATWSPELSTERIRLVPSGTAPLAQDGTAVRQMAAVDVRWWLQRGPASVRLGVGTLQLLHPATEAVPQPGAETQPLAPTVSVGMRVLMTRQSALYADASGAVGLPTDSGLGYVRTKVGLEWKPAKSRLGLDQGRVGIQFDSGYRLSLRLRRGGVGVYLRGQF